MKMAQRKCHQQKNKKQNKTNLHIKETLGAILQNSKHKGYNVGSGSKLREEYDN